MKREIIIVFVLLFVIAAYSFNVDEDLLDKKQNKQMTGLWFKGHQGYLKKYFLFYGLKQILCFN